MLALSKVRKNCWAKAQRAKAAHRCRQEVIFAAISKFCHEHVVDRGDLSFQVAELG